MTTQLLATELANLIQESKRKHNDLRQAAEKSLDELKTLRGSEAQNTSELANRPAFVNPFIIACGTKNPKFTSIAIVCFQRLVIAKALPRAKLGPILEALSQAASAGLDVQLKILQALPPLLTNYAEEVRDELLVTALNICFVLQASKNAIVNNTSAATLQQLVVAVFDKVVTEDKKETAQFVGEAPGGDGLVKLRPAAMDAYRVFSDLYLMTENQRPEYLRFQGLPQTFGLELIESVLTNHAPIFVSHEEQGEILRQQVMPFLISALKGRPNFATSVRLTRILYTLMRRHLGILPQGCGEALEILTHMLDQDTVVWRRVLCMEVFRGIFSEPPLVRRIFLLYDSREGQKDILKTLTAMFVRLSAERPVVIGLGSYSTIPVVNPYAASGASGDQVVLESGGVAGIIGASGEGATTGISTQWSTVRIPFIDQLDKAEAPPIPESYMYSLVLTCVSSLSEGLAKFILPLTVPTRSKKQEIDEAADRSFKKNPVPVNPLTLEDHPLKTEIRVCANIIEECWPAVLATCSTFLNAALDSEYYHSLVRAFQRFAHVAGLLELFTPRDAFLTTLGKAAVPPNVFTACLNSGSTKATDASAATTAGSLLSNARGLLTRDSGPMSPTGDRHRLPSTEATAISLNTRNLLCLRALLNLGIALGPTMGESWRIILETLQQADFVLFSSGKTPGRTPLVAKIQDSAAEAEASTLLGNFGGEIRAVETAAARLVESTVDFPNGEFLMVVKAICVLLEFEEEDPTMLAPGVEGTKGLEPPNAPGHAKRGSISSASGKHRRVLSVSSVASSAPNQEDMFALAKLGDLAFINIERLLSFPPAESGWTLLVGKLIEVLSGQSTSPSVRTRTADILVRLILDGAKTVSPLKPSLRGPIQLNLLEALRDSLIPMVRKKATGNVSSNMTDIDIHRIVLDGLKNLLETCGETLVAGWEVAFAVVDSVFEDSSGGIVARSPRLVRPGFGSLELICSDFLAALPNKCFLLLVDTLYKFSSQDDDLNISLTTVTFFWALSDFLSGKSQSLKITEATVSEKSVQELSLLASDPSNPSSDPALWMLLLLRLATVTADNRLELRNSAIQTLLRIFDAYGDKLDSEAWSVCVKSVIFDLLVKIEGEAEMANGDGVEEGERGDWNATVEVILMGISGLLSNYLDVLKTDRSFPDIWKKLLGHFAKLLNLKSLSVNTAVFRAFSQIIKPAAVGSLEEEIINEAWNLWSRGVPKSKDEEKGMTFSDTMDNQECMISYVSFASDLYRFIHPNLTLERVKTMLELMREAVRQASIGTLMMDIEFCTKLQDRVLDVIKMIRTDIPRVPAELISQCAQFSLMAFEKYPLPPSTTLSEDECKGRRTFMALAKESMEIMRDLVLKHHADSNIYTSGSFTATLAAFVRPISLKYSMPLTPRTPVWKLATTAALTVLQKALPTAGAMSLGTETTYEIWEGIVDLAQGIVATETFTIPENNVKGMTDDEDFDVAAFYRLRDLIVPSLGSKNVEKKSRKRFAEVLFRGSIAHELAPAEEEIMGDDPSAVERLRKFFETRVGRTQDPKVRSRVKMAYVCLDEMFALVTGESEHMPSIMIVPPTPQFNTFEREIGGNGGEQPVIINSSSTKFIPELRAEIASAIAPVLFFRSAMVMRAYISDRPLRGHMPRRLSQRKELLHILTRLVELHVMSGALPEIRKVDAGSRKHLVVLSPLLGEVARVAGKMGDEEELGVVTEGLAVVAKGFEGMPREGKVLALAEIHKKRVARG